MITALYIMIYDHSSGTFIHLYGCKGLTGSPQLESDNPKKFYIMNYDNPPLYNKVMTSEKLLERVYCV